MPDNISTLFVTGFSDDASPRELLNLCRLCPGFEFTVAHPHQLFVKFESEHKARQALKQLNGFMFDETDPENSPDLRAEFAKRDADPKRLGLGDGAGERQCDTERPGRARRG